VAGVLMAWFDSTHRENVIITPGDLMKRVESWKLPGTDNWPKSAKGFADALRRAAPALRHVGIEVGPLKQKKSHGMIPWQVVDIEMPK